MKIMRLGKFLRMSLREQFLFLEAFSLQLWVGFILKVIPFRWIPRVFADADSREHPPVGGQAETGGMEGHDSNLTSHLSPLQQIKEATERAGRLSPWKNRCLVSSLAARCMLRRRRINSRLSLGVARADNDSVIAHAWLSSEGFELVARDGEYTTMYIF